MIRLKGVCLVVAWFFLNASHLDADTMQLFFDGTTDGGWTISNQPAHGPFPVMDAEDTGQPGIAFDDNAVGVAYYTAPASFTAQDFIGNVLEFQMFIRDFSADASLVDDAPGSADLMINGTGIDVDVISEEQLGVVQTVNVDFSDPAFSAVDLNNVTTLEIRAEYWSVGALQESVLIGVPEPTALATMLWGLLGVFCWRKRS